jgi:hypothetical protein
LTDLDFAKWDQAIEGFERARTTLRTLAGQAGTSVSRMVEIQVELASVGNNLQMAYESDPVRFARPARALVDELYETCDKLSLVIRPLPFILRKVYASSCLDKTENQEQDGGQPDLDLLLKAERLWDENLREKPADVETRGMLVIVRQKLADELAARGRSDESSRSRRRALTTVRGDPGLFVLVATVYAETAGLVGRLPTRLAAPELDAQRARSEKYALAMLREAVDEGFHDPARLRNEPAFAPLRAVPEFQAILDDLAVPVDPFAGP